MPLELGNSIRSPNVWLLLVVSVQCIVSVGVGVQRDERFDWQTNQNYHQNSHHLQPQAQQQRLHHQPQSSSQGPASVLSNQRPASPMEQHHLISISPAAHSKGLLVMPPNNDQILASASTSDNLIHSHGSAANWREHHQQVSLGSRHPLASSNLSSSPLPTTSYPRALGDSSSTHHEANRNQNGQQQAGSTLLSHNLELALRQATGDESVFQPLAAFGSMATNSDGHNMDTWFMGQPSAAPGASSSSNGYTNQISTTSQSATKITETSTPSTLNQHPDSDRGFADDLFAYQSIGSTPIGHPTVPSTARATAAVGSTQSQVAGEIHQSTSDPASKLTTTTTSSLMSNQNANQVGKNQNQHEARHVPLAAVSTTAATSASIGGLQKEYQTNNYHHEQQQQQPTGSISQQQYSPAIEFNNQIVYEGPATAPPVDDYYFSSAEKLPSYGDQHSSNGWWAIGIGHHFERASNLTRDDYLDYCDKSHLLVSNKQRALCRMHPRVMHIVARGLKLAIDECQTRFTNSRWNCSVVLEDSLQVNNNNNNNLYANLTRQPLVFGDVMQHPNRERSYLNAIIAAGLAHAMTKACSQGELPEECSCDKKIRPKSNKGKIEWVACSDDIDYGARFSRDFTDNYEIESDATSTIYLHNNEVGRRVFKSATDITCTCLNGENGLCQTKRCWRHLGAFSDVGDELMKRYESATHVQRSNKDPHKLRPVRRGVRKPKRKDLVYIDESPDYCQTDLRIGVLGTRDRRCNSTSMGPDSCSLLCCGRGYQVVVDTIEEDCNCKFVWCCHVKCDTCKRHVTNDVCN